MEFKIKVTVDKNATRADVKLRLEQAINESAFKWVDNFIVTDPSGYHDAYLEGLRKGEEILNQVLNKVKG
tara:strand:- start:293 stop:502 length:210 start_codon:yes stop_codon:yes gene_type:complete